MTDVKPVADVGKIPRHTFLTAREVIARYGWGRTKGYQVLRRRDFPRPVVGDRYRLDTLMAWEDSQVQERQRPNEYTSTPLPDAQATSSLSQVVMILASDAGVGPTSTRCVRCIPVDRRQHSALPSRYIIAKKVRLHACEIVSFLLVLDELGTFHSTIARSVIWKVPPFQSRLTTTSLRVPEPARHLAASRHGALGAEALEGYPLGRHFHGVRRNVRRV